MTWHPNQTITTEDGDYSDRSIDYVLGDSVTELWETDALSQFFKINMIYPGNVCEYWAQRNVKWLYHSSVYNINNPFFVNHHGSFFVIFLFTYVWHVSNDLNYFWSRWWHACSCPLGGERCVASPESKTENLPLDGEEGVCGRFCSPAHNIQS